MYDYYLAQWLLFFFIYCFFGWIWESCYVSVKKRKWVNRGFLHGPLIPIYGFGAVTVLLVVIPVREHLVLVYFLGMAAATVLEYVTGAAMEKLFKVRYWDYSEKPMNLHGYICLVSSLAWGAFSVLLIHVIHMPVERLVLGIDEGLAYGIVGIVGTVFVADVIESTKAALELGQALEAMVRMRRELEEMQVQFALLKCELRDQAEQSLERLQKEAALHLAELRRENDARMEGIRDHVLAEKIRLLEEKAEKHREKARLWRERLSGLQKFYFKGILEGNRLSIPGGYKEMLDELREELKKKKGK